mgnify:CR=1 FL=1
MPLFLFASVARYFLLQRLLQNLKVLLHHAEVGLAVRNVLLGHGLHGVENQNLLILLLRVLLNRVCNLLIGVLNHKDVVQLLLIHLLREEAHGLEARLGVRGAAHKRCAVVKSVVIHEIAEREAIAEEQVLIRSVLYDIRILRVELGELLIVSLCVLLVVLCVCRIQRGEILRNLVHIELCVLQGEPYVLVVLGLLVVIVACELIVHFLCRHRSRIEGRPVALGILDCVKALVAKADVEMLRLRRLDHVVVDFNVNRRAGILILGLKAIHRSLCARGPVLDVGAEILIRGLHFLAALIRKADRIAVDVDLCDIALKALQAVSLVLFRRHLVSLGHQQTLDAEAWCQTTGNNFITSTIQKGYHTVVIEKNAPVECTSHTTSNSKNKTLIMFSDDLDKALATFVLANGAAATGHKVSIFFTFWGLNVLKREKKPKVKKDFFGKMFSWMLPKSSRSLHLSQMSMLGIGDRLIRHIMRKKNINSLEELRDQALANGVEFIACQMSMDMMGIDKEEFIDGVSIGGVATYMQRAEEANVNLFI